MADLTAAHKDLMALDGGYVLFELSDFIGQLLPSQQMGHTNI